MPRFLRLFLIATFALPATAGAQAAPKPVAVIYFSASLATGHYDAPLGRMIQQARQEFALDIRAYPLDREEKLADTVEKIADGDTGFIIIVQPHDIPALMKLPGLYPDIHFSIIGPDAPLYLTNVQSLLFREEEGTFLIGALAARHAQADKKTAIGFVSSEDNTSARNLAYGFFQGAKYAAPAMEVLRQLGARGGSKTLSAMQALQQQLDSGADSLLVIDAELWPQAFRLARKHKRLLITCGDSLPKPASGLVLTSLRKRYDLATYDALKTYSQGLWKPDSHYLGIGGGYMDYVLGDGNKALFSPALIEAAETIKDKVAQGSVHVAHYTVQ